jgi:hypothetical protein
MSRRVIIVYNSFSTRDAAQSKLLKTQLAEVSLELRRASARDRRALVTEHTLILTKLRQLDGVGTPEEVAFGEGWHNPKEKVSPYSEPELTKAWERGKTAAGQAKKLKGNYFQGEVRGKRFEKPSVRRGPADPGHIADANSLRRGSKIRLKGQQTVWTVVSVGRDDTVEVERKSDEGRIFHHVFRIEATEEVHDAQMHKPDKPSYYEIVDETGKVLATVSKSKALQTKSKLEQETGKKLELKLKANDGSRDFKSERGYVGRLIDAQTGALLARSEPYISNGPRLKEWIQAKARELIQRGKRVKAEVTMEFYDPERV